MVSVAFLSVPSFWGIHLEIITSRQFNIKVNILTTEDFITKNNVQKFESPFKTDSNTFGLVPFGRGQDQLTTLISNFQPDFSSSFLLKNNQKCDDQIMASLTTFFIFILNKTTFWYENEYISIRKQLHLNDIGYWYARSIDPIPIPP